MKIKAVTGRTVEFTGDHWLWYEHASREGEVNFADFSFLTRAMEYEFDEDSFFVEQWGADCVRIGDKNEYFWFPCYSEQPGYCPADVEIIYDGDLACVVEGEVRRCR